MKAYTDIEQSCKLGEILPKESSDMYWDLLSKDKYARVNNIGYCLCRYCVYAWSLSALLDVLPDRICLDNEKYYLNYKKDKVEYLGPVTWDGQKCVTTKANTIVDACVEMILKLNELKLL